QVVVAGDAEGEHDGPDEDEVDVLDHEVADVEFEAADHDHGDEAERPAGQGEPATPDQGADRVVEGVLLVVHVTHAGRDGGEGADNWYEPGDDHGEPAEPLEEAVRAADVLDAEQPRLFAFEDPRSGAMADDVPDFATEECRDRDREAHPPDVELDDPRE